MIGPRSEDARLALRAVASLAILALVAAGSTVAVRWAYGGYDHDARIDARFPHAGQALQAGSDVKYRGVNVGKVRSVRLAGRGEDVVLELKPWAKVPRSTTATVKPKTIFGEKYVELATRPGAPGQYLRTGDRLRPGPTSLK